MNQTKQRPPSKVQRQISQAQEDYHRARSLRRFDKATQHELTELARKPDLQDLWARVKALVPVRLQQAVVRDAIRRAEKS